jgi:hypothetical protein
MSISPNELVVLRCVKCGAPLTRSPAEAEYLKCDFCGFTQKSVDVKQYLDKLRGEVYNWLQAMVPAGAIVSAVADPLARHNIFSINIKPRILGEYAAVKSRLSMVLTHPLFAFPFQSSNTFRVQDDSRTCFENVAKIQGLEPMAVVEEDRTFFDDIKATYEMHAYIVNALGLVASKSDPSLLVNNFQMMATALEKIPQRNIEYKRMHGIAEAYQATEAFMKSDLDAAKTLIGNAAKTLQEVAVEARKSPTSAVMVPATLSEVSNVKAMENLVAACGTLADLGHPSGEMLPYFSKYFMKLDTVRGGPSPSTYHELSAYLKNILEARAGASHLEVLPGAGNLYLPMWDILVTYTFATGALFMKKGKDVEDRLLVLGTVPLAEKTVTDVFAQSSRMMDRLSGKESTLTTGYVGNVLAQTRRTSLPASSRIVPPLLTREEGEKVAEEYLQRVSQRMGGKIKFGAARSVRLVYGTAEIRGNDIHIPCLGDSQVSLGAHFNQVMAMAVGSPPTKAPTSRPTSHFCVYCGSALTANSVFCMSCGRAAV